MSPTEELIAECHRQSENCSYTALTFTNWLRVLRISKTFSAVAPILCGGLATWKIMAQNAQVLAATAALFATVIPPTYRASGTDSKIKEFETLAGEFTNLRDAFRQAALITSHKPFTEFETAVKPLFTRMEKARQKALTPPEWCFKLARRKIQAGHYHHDYDEAVKS